MSEISSFNVNGNIIGLTSSSNVDVSTDLTQADLNIGDDNGNILAEFKDGHFKTKNFDSRDMVDSSISLSCFMDKNEDGATGVDPITNSLWAGFSERRYSFGFNSRQTPFYNTSFTVGDGTIICAGDTSKMRWGYHAYEAYAKDKLSRITMLLNKHTEEEKPLAELYYYLTAYNHSEAAYGFFKIGSDVRQHSFLFSRDICISYGAHDFRNIIELASIDPSTDLITSYDTVAQADSAYEPDSQYANNAKCVLYLALKDARDGAMFYDNQRNKIVVKINGVWCDVQSTPVDDGTYNF